MDEGNELEFPPIDVLLRASTPPRSPTELQSSTAQDVRRQSVAEKKRKKTPRKATDANTLVKPKQSKSRNGCMTCKQKRLKCGEERPQCQQCKRRNVVCGGYKKEFKWRPFNEEITVKVNVDRQKQVPARRPAPAESSGSTTPTTETTPGHATVEENQGPNGKDSKEAETTTDERSTAQLSHRPGKARRISRPSSRDEESSSPAQDQAQVGFENGLSALNHIHSLGEEEHPSLPIATQGVHQPPRGPTAAITVPRGLSPTLTEILRIDDDSPNDEDFINFLLPEGIHYPIPSLPAVDPALLQNDAAEHNLDEVLRSRPHTSDGQLSVTSRRNTTPSSPALEFPSDNMLGPWLGPDFFPFNQPLFAEDSPEMLTVRFDSMTCGILSVMDGPNENPWRSLIWPLAQQSPALYHAVLAMTAFHSSKDVAALRVVGHEHKQASIRYIQEGIRDSSMTDQTAIATALALGFSESWDQHTATGNTHIKGAQILVKRAIAQAHVLSGVELSRLKFLCNAWVYMDVIARLTSVDSDESNDFDNTFLFASDPPNMVMGDSGPPGFGIDFGMPIDARLDPLMGCANTLFPLIGRVANLVRKVCRSQTNSAPLISQAGELKAALETWEPPAFIERPEDPTTDVQHTLQTAEAYRWATLLHLHQSVPELPSLSSAELAQRVLQYLATVPLGSRTVIVQIYPLMVAGCEATTEEDREWVRGRWAAMGRRMRIGVIDKSDTVTKEVWRRRDTYEAQPSTRRRLVATADLQPARQRGTPLDRMHGAFEDSDPGRTGMVFSYVDTDVDHPTASNDRRPSRRNVPDRVMGAMDPAYTVRGHLHWVGVMWDWGWEVLLG